MVMIVQKKKGGAIIVKDVEKWITKYIQMAVTEIIIHALQDGLDVEKIDKKQMEFLVAFKTKNILEVDFNISDSNIESFMKLHNNI